MSNASHRKPEAVKTPRIPWGHALTVVVLIAALFAGIMLAASVASPPASAAYVTSAVTAAKAVTVPAGCKTPEGTLPSGDPARFAGHAYVCTGGAWVPVTSYGYWASWSQVKAYCRFMRDCKNVPAWIKHEEGISPHHPALMETGNTTTIWIKARHGVRVEMS